MTSYKAPLKDIQFTMNEMFKFPEHFSRLNGCEEIGSDLVEAILEEAGKFTGEVLAPLNQVGDREGAKWNDGVVTTPTGFKEAYRDFIAGGWQSLDKPAEYSGQGMPKSIGLVLNEMLGTANWAWAMYVTISHGSIETIEKYGTDEQKALYLEKLIEGIWSGTMCLTEAHCGTDLGLLRTSAKPKPDGSYEITGTKIFISAGDHDLTVGGDYHFETG